MLGFYWINEDELVAVTNRFTTEFTSDDYSFIEINGMSISNNRNGKDYASLNRDW